MPVATAYTAADIANDPHMQARHDLVTVDDCDHRPGAQQAPFPASWASRCHGPVERTEAR